MAELADGEENRQVLRVLEALKQASHELQSNPASNSPDSNASAIKALLELETGADSILSADPYLSALSHHLASLKSIVDSLEKSRSRHGIRSFLTQRVSTHELSRVAGSIESEIQAWIDRESIETLARALARSPPDQAALTRLLDQFVARLADGFNHELQDLVLKSRVFQELESVLCNSDYSTELREQVAFAIAELIKFNKDVFVGQVLMSQTIRALISIASPSSLKVLCSIIKAIKSPLVDEIESNGEIPKIINFLKSEDASIRVMAMNCVLEIGHESLLSSIFGMSMWNYEPDVMDALIELITSLAASSGKYVDSCLEMLISNFMPPHSFTELLKQPCGVARKSQVLYRIHSALKDITDLVPLAPLRLLPIVLQRMPNVYNKEPLIVAYVENMLRLESGAMGELVGSMMLIAVVDRLIDLDVEIEWEDILQDDSCKSIFEMELEDMEDTIDEEDAMLQRESSSGRSLRGNVVAEKLDSLLVLMFEHLKSCKDAGRLNKVFETLLQSFEVTVLSAYKSKFAQFVTFYACSLDPENCGMRFADALSDIFTGSACPPVKRMSAVAYLASYLSRAKFLSVSFVIKILQRLVSWCWKYTEDEVSNINPKAHRVFYSGCQAIMYVLCFHMRSVMDIPRLKSQLFLMPLEAILKHPLSPLKVCLPSIVQEFLRQARAARLFTVSETFVFNDLLESELSRAFGGMERLDMFFPFDPYLLKKSDRFIRPNFVYWSVVRTTYDEEDDDDEDGGSSDEDFDDFIDCKRENTARDWDAMAGSFEEHEIDLDEFDHSLNKMSITPNNSLSHRFGGRELHGGATRMPSRIRPSTSPESL